MALVTFALDVNLCQMDDGTVSWVIQYLNYGRESGREGFLPNADYLEEVEHACDRLLDALSATNDSLPLPTIQLRRRPTTGGPPALSLF
jgi:hypothetical protein